MTQQLYDAESGVLHSLILTLGPDRRWTWGIDAEHVKSGHIERLEDSPGSYSTANAAARDGESALASVLA